MLDTDSQETRGAMRRRKGRRRRRKFVQIHIQVQVQVQQVPLAIHSVEIGTRAVPRWAVASEVAKYLADRFVWSASL